MAAVPGAVAGDAFMPAALATDVAGEAAPAAESTGLLGGLKAGARGLYSDALNSAPAQNLGLSQVYPGPPAPDGSMSVGLSQNVMKAGDYASKLGKAQKAYQSAQGLLGGGQPRGGGAAPAQQRQFGQGASPVNFAQMTAQPNMMMQPQGGQQLPPQLAMLPPNDPRVLAYLQQMGGMYG
jgi:hypothetical protein